MFCQVIIDIVHENVASPFTYRIPEGMQLQPGQRVSVPFGRLQKEGIVLSLTEQCELEANRIRNVIGIAMIFSQSVFSLRRRITAKTATPHAKADANSN